MNNSQGGDFTQVAPAWLRRIGIQSWLFVGVVLAALVFLSILSILSQLVNALVISLLLAILSRPLVDWLEAHKTPRPLGAILTIILILMAVVGLIWIIVRGVIQQGPEISVQLQAGLMSLGLWLSGYNIQLPSAGSIMQSIQSVMPSLFEGLFGFVGTTVSTILEVVIGLFFTIFILFFLLRDTRQIESWIARQINHEYEVGASIVQDAGHTVLVYFRGTALTALVTSVVVAIPLILLKVPLVAAILILYFVTSFIPYIGAWIAGAFAVLIALGSGGIVTAWIVLTAVIISNGALQSAVSSWALGSMLKLHPLVIFLVTIIAGSVGGILLMILAVPMTAFVLHIWRLLRQERLSPA